MIVLDASAVVELILNRPLGRIVAERLRGDPAEPLAAPHLIDAEVGQVLRRFERRHELAEWQARAGLRNLSGLPISRFPHGPFLERAFDLRANVTVYDGLYLVLAETLGATMLTADAELVGVPGCSATVELLGRDDQA